MTNRNLRLKKFLDAGVELYNRPDFIVNDPVCIPHQYTKIQDIEIAGFWSSILAWGQRKTIINKANELFYYMDKAPHDFILNHGEKDIKPFLQFKHRTFTVIDTLYFLHFLQQFYKKNDSLEQAFLCPDYKNEASTENMLVHFQKVFFSLADAPQRTRKHISSPLSKSTCKRLNMFLRWMVRKDNCGVDFGIWKSILPSQLICPLDLHVDRVARKLKLINRKQTDWLTAVELTDMLKKFDPQDPVKYDFALFGSGIAHNWHDINEV